MKWQSTTEKLASPAQPSPAAQPCRMVGTVCKMVKHDLTDLIAVISTLN